MTIKDFNSGDSVRYIPKHAKGNINHPECENGIVTSTNEKYVFVRYIRNNVLQSTAAATLPEQLIKFYEK